MFIYNQSSSICSACHLRNRSQTFSLKLLQTQFLVLWDEGNFTALLDKFTGLHPKPINHPNPHFQFLRLLFHPLRRNHFRLPPRTLQNNSNPFFGLLCGNGCVGWIGIPTGPNDGGMVFNWIGVGGVRDGRNQTVCFSVWRGSIYTITNWSNFNVFLSVLLCYQCRKCPFDAHHPNYKTKYPLVRTSFNHEFIY